MWPFIGRIQSFISTTLGRLASLFRRPHCWSLLHASRPSQVLLPKRSQCHYYEDGDIVFRVESTLFRLFLTPLMQQSEIFSNILSIPMTGGVDDGKSDQTPIYLEGILERDFNVFLDFLMLNYDGSKDWDVLKLVKLHQVSGQWVVPAGEAFAIEMLSEHKDLTGVLRLLVARTCSHTPWIPDALTQILSGPFLGRSLTSSHLRGIQFACGNGFLEDLISRHSYLQRLRYRYAFPPDFVWDSTCGNDMSRCKAGVAQAWEALVYKPRVLEQRRPVITLEQLREAFITAGVCRSCVEATMDGLDDNFFEVETVAIARAVHTLVERWFNDQ